MQSKLTEIMRAESNAIIQKWGRLGETKELECERYGGFQVDKLAHN
jgi:hypothetical protein